jgi:hypothetical protein
MTDISRRGFLKALGLGTAAVAVFGAAGCSDPRDTRTASEHAAEAKKLAKEIIDDINDVRYQMRAPDDDKFGLQSVYNRDQIPMIVGPNDGKRGEDYPPDAVVIDVNKLTTADVEFLSYASAQVSTYYGRLAWDMEHPDGEGPDAPQPKEVTALIEDIGKATIEKGAAVGQKFENFQYHLKKGNVTLAAPAGDAPGADPR